MYFDRTLLPLTLLFTMLWLASPASGQTISMAELDARLADHPSLLALGYQAEASRERSTAAGALPDPVLSLGINNFPIFDPSFSEFLPTNKSIAWRQEFPNRAIRKARTDEALAMAEQTDKMRDAQLASLRAELITLLYEKTRIASQRDLAQARHTKYAELTDVVAAEIDSGQPAVFRLAQIQAERAGVDGELVDLERQDRELNARLIELVGLIPDTSPPSMSPGTWSEEPLDFHAVQVAAASINIAGYSVDGAEAAMRPNWGAQLTYQQRESGDNFSGEDWVSGMLTFSLPIWAERSQEPRLRAAQADRASAQMRYMAAARSATARYTAEVAAYEASANSIAALERNITSVRDKIASQLTTYESGVGTYAPVISGDIAILKLRAQIVAEQARRGASIARINALLVTS